MEPVAAVSLVCNVFDLTERAIKCAKMARDIYNSTTGLSKEHEQLSELTNELNTILSEVRSSYGELQKIDVGDINIQAVASECQNFSSDISTLLDRCRIKKPSSMKSAIGATKRSYHNKDNLQTLQINLEKRQQMLHLALTASIIKVEKTLNEEHVTNYTLKQELGAIQQKFDTLVDIPGQLQQALDLCREAQKERVLHNVFRVLSNKNNGMKSNPRYDEVHDAYGNTFEWILLEPEKVFKVEPDLTLSFVDWLRDGHGIFHILGKPGSGKSTLMKFIWNQKVRKDMLQQWAGESRLLCMKYFFWKPGSGQNGLQDLRRSLLKSALEQAPELLSLLLPRISEHNTTLDEYLNDGEISQACQTLMSNQHVLAKHKIFILIDGLDEFDEERNHEDFNDLVRVLQGWTYQSEGKVKACVSSREYDAFRTITHNQKFHLQNLTREDMETFVTKRLEEHSQFSKLECACEKNTRNLCGRDKKLHTCNLDCLVEHIVDAAHGVFLWISLMVSEIRRNLECSLNKLWKLVDTEPKRLTGFIEHMLDSISPPYQREAYILLAVAHKYATMGCPSHTLSKLHLPTKGACYLWKKLLQDKTEPGSQESEINESVNWDIFTSEEVDARFNGLLERFHVDLPSELLSFLFFSHRSIIEVLDDCIDAKLRTHGITQVELGKCICQTFLGDMIFVYKEIERTGLTIDHFETIVSGQPFRVLTILRDMGLHAEPWFAQQLDQIEDFYQRIQFGIPHPSEAHWQSATPSLPGYRSLVWVPSYLGLHELLPWVLKRLSDVPKRGHTALETVLWSSPESTDSVNKSGQLIILAGLLKHGYVGVDILKRGTGLQMTKDRCHTSVAWISCVMQLVRRQGNSHTIDWEAPKLWLESRANPRVYIPKHPDDELCYVKIDGGWYLVKQKNTQSIDFPITGRISQLPEGPGSTLGGLIDRLDPPNKERLLELIDRNTAWMEADEAAETLANFEELPSVDVLDIPEYTPTRKTVWTIWSAYIQELRYMLPGVKPPSTQNQSTKSNTIEHTNTPTIAKPST
ncbi:uncharacterized protein GGS22DRAFT_181485 [Annulohypoxylon maeteangense]|uniref:uncharacterized protein n=1 Tax=Annulohypoxylon maeteangense TaxID=1927788 RepID=UPI0020089BCF|nr:uncharacterized protein GGS22DRAFT_181485 [Annulohypoxylon maeteangense]KAI0881704.1 hypothetical protein GGS22DRAFT_181485 [Annulohypoxylon maeteangense]